MPILAGWREWLSLPGLAIPAIKAKIDTGARTSALHVFDLEVHTENDLQKVKFKIHPLQKRTDIVIGCEATVIDERFVSDSGGHRERRLVIRTPVRLGDREWPIEITLANREEMLFRMLLGRTAMEHNVVIDPRLSYQCGRRLRKAYRTYSISLEPSPKKST